MGKSHCRLRRLDQPGKLRAAYLRDDATSGTLCYAICLAPTELLGGRAHTGHSLWRLLAWFGSSRRVPSTDNRRTCCRFLAIPRGCPSSGYFPGASTTPSPATPPRYPIAAPRL